MPFPNDRGPSEHLAWIEMACWDRSRTPKKLVAPYPPQWRDQRGVAVAETFESIRFAAGNHPIAIGSCYRTPTHNAAVGGATGSMHKEGLALDLHTPAGLTNVQLYHIADRVLGNRGGLFLYSWGVHVDRRDLLGRPKARGNFTVQKLEASE